MHAAQLYDIVLAGLYWAEYICPYVRSSPQRLLLLLLTSVYNGIAIV